MPQFPHEEVAFESGINVRFTIYNSNNDYIPEHWHRSMEVIYIYEGSGPRHRPGFCYYRFLMRFSYVASQNMKASVFCSPTGILLPMRRFRRF